jgi:hypothetical protein
MTAAATPRPSPNVVMTELDDATGVLLSLDTKIYYTLNATGVFVWKTMAQDASLDVAQLAEKVAANFEVEHDVAARDLKEMLDELVAEGLVRVVAR